jgi:LmbE family N-acetylglucosaminyl deacetylase
MFLLSGSNLSDTKPNLTDSEAGVDLMLVVAHPGDEYLYLGGVLPYYATELGHTAVVVYLTSVDETQRQEARASLKALCVSEEPVFGGFENVYANDLDEMKECWSERELQSFLTGVIRKYRPAVVVSHDLNGEYGNAAHKLTARAVRLAVKNAANDRYDVTSLNEYGAWQVQRLFLHFYKDGDAEVRVDRNAPLTAFSGRTAVEVEEDLYESFSEAYRYPLDVGDETYGAADYGLVSSKYGLKTLPQDDDFFYGLRTAVLNGPNAVGIYVSSTLSQAAEPPAEPAKDSYYRSEDYPKEVVIEDWDNEHWEYRTDTLSIIIDRIHTTNARGRPVCYCVAHVRMRGEDAFRAGVRGEEGGTRSNEVPTDMARRYQAVLAVTGDNLSVNESDLKGIIIRNGRVYNKKTAADCMALMADLSMKIYSPGETTPDDLLALGVTNVFSFGPTLIRDGVVNFNASGIRSAGSIRARGSG